MSVLVSTLSMRKPCDGRAGNIGAIRGAALIAHHMGFADATYTCAWANRTPEFSKSKEEYESANDRP